MNAKDPLFAAFAAAVCRAISANIIETRAALKVLVDRELLSDAQIAEAKKQMSFDLAYRIASDLEAQVMTTMKEEYQKLRSRHR
jgi:hypothetical protein